MPILVDPPCYLDPVASEIGPFSASQLSQQQLKALLAAPPVPEKMAEEFSYRLTVDHPELDLPAPKKIKVTEIPDFEPAPHLTLYGEQTVAKHYVHSMALNFKYGDWLVPALYNKDYSIVKSRDKLFKIKRNLELERISIDKIKGLGFSQPILADSANHELILGSYGKSPMESTARWGHFLEHVVPELKSEGWKIEFRDSFLLDFTSIDTWDAEINESQNDWFEMKFNIDVGGQSMPLLPLIMPILENYDLDNLPDILNIPLSDFRYLTVPSEKMKPILAVLLELFGGSRLEKDGSLKVSRFNAASVADMESHSYGLFSIKGGEELRKIAQKLNDFKGIEDVPVPHNLHATLRDYQRKGLNWLQFPARIRLCRHLGGRHGFWAKPYKRSPTYCSKNRMAG